MILEYKVVKRHLDIICSILGLIILLPLFIIVAILIKLESKGPIFYKQLRLGLHGKDLLYKFLTMYLGRKRRSI